MSILRHLIGYFVSPAGVLVMGALDSSLVFFLPLGVDTVVVALAARNPGLFWLPAVLATAGSLAGAAVTFAIGRALGDRALTWFVPARRIESVRHRVRHGVALTALLGLVPPPFPFTAFVVAAGALNASKRRFFGTLAAVRLLRFGAAAWLAGRFGQHVTAWLDSRAFEVLALVLVAAAVVGTVLSSVKCARSMRQPRPEPDWLVAGNS